MVRTLAAVVLFGLPVALVASDPPTPPADEPSQQIRRLKRELDLLTLQQAELTKKVEAKAKQLKEAEREAGGSVRLTVDGLLKKEGSAYYIPIQSGITLGGDRAYIVGTAEQLKPLAELVGKKVTVTGAPVINTLDRGANRAGPWAAHDVPYGHLGVALATVRAQEKGPEPEKK